MSLRDKFADTLAPAIDCNAPYAKVMIAKLVEIATNDAAEQRAELLEALDEIINPISHMRKRADAEGGVLNGPMALNIANSAAHLQSIARAAIAKATGAAS